MFSEYHYMDKKINNANRFFVAWWRAHPVGCVAATGFPGSVIYLIPRHLLNTHTHTHTHTHTPTHTLTHTHTHTHTHVNTYIYIYMYVVTCC